TLCLLSVVVSSRLSLLLTLPLTSFFVFSFHSYVDLRDLHSFPTRRSSDLSCLALGERHTESRVNAHHLSGRTHLGAQDRVHETSLIGTEPAERHHRLFDRHRRIGPGITQFAGRSEIGSGEHAFGT